MLFLPIPTKLEIIPKSRLRHLNEFEIQISDNKEVDKLNTIVKSLPELID